MDKVLSVWKASLYSANDQQLECESMLLNITQTFLDDVAKYRRLLAGDERIEYVSIAIDKDLFRFIDASGEQYACTDIDSSLQIGRYGTDMSFVTSDDTMHPDTFNLLSLHNQCSSASEEELLRCYMRTLLPPPPELLGALHGAGLTQNADFGKLILKTASELDPPITWSALEEEYRELYGGNLLPWLNAIDREQALDNVAGALPRQRGRVSL